MDRVVNVNWDELNNSKKDFDSQVGEILDIRNELLKTIEMIDNGWCGYDADNYKKNFNEFLKKYYSEAKYLDKWSKYLNKSSNNYSNNVEEGIKKVRNVEEEYEIEK